MEGIAYQPITCYSWYCCTNVLR